MSDPSTCPTPAVLDAWAAGALQGEAHADASRHIPSCEGCRQRLNGRGALESTLTADSAGLDTTMVASDPQRPESIALAIIDEAEGRYEIVRELGRGGQSIVYLARDLHLDRDVALKVPRRDENGGVPAEALAQFLREARITARLEHPNIVPIHEIGRRRDGTAYCTQRLIGGKADGDVRTLSSALRTARTLDERLGLVSHVVDVCAAIAHAHAKGVVHRDLKPDNIVIGELRETVVLDWGVAKSASERDVEALVVGTPMYMAPEQARGDSAAVDERSDIFSLGVILYELITGAPPYTGDTVAYVLEQARSAAIAPVLTKEPDAPRAFAAVIERCLSPDRARRYASAAELGAELRDFLAHRPVRAYSYRAGELIRLFVERHKAVSAIAAISIVLLSALGVATFVSYQRARAYLSEALVEKARASEAALRWDEAAAYFAAARVQSDTPAARYGAMLALSRADTRVRRLRGHNGSVKALSVSADTTRLVSGGFDGTLKLWDARSGGLLWSLDLGGGPISSVAFSADGASIFAAAEDHEVRHIAVSGQVSGVVHSAAELVNQVVVSRDGALLALALEDNSVVLITLADGTVRTLRGHTNPVYAVAISPDGTLLASGGWDRTIRLWDLATGSERRVLIGNEDSVLALGFTADAKTLVSGSRDRSVRLWDVERAAMKERLSGHQQRVTAVALSPDSSRAASVSTDRSVRLWSLVPVPRTLVGDSLGLDEGLTCVAFVNEELIVFGGEDGALYLKSVTPPERIPSGIVLLPAADDLSFAAGKLINTASAQGHYRHLEERDLRTLEVVWRSPPMPDQTNWESEVPSAAVGVSVSGALISGTCGVRSCEGPYCAGPGSRLLLCIAEAATMRKRHVMNLDFVPWSSAVSPDDREVAVGARAGELFIYDAGSGALKRTFKDARTGVFSVAYSRDGRWLAAGSYDRALRVYDTSTWKMRELGAHEHGIRMVRFSPNSRVIATGGYDRIIRLWDAESGNELGRLKGHEEAIRAIAFSPDGALLASGAWDGTVRLWDVATRVELARYVANDTRVHSVAFAPDGAALFYSGVQPYRVEFPRLLSPEDGLATTLEQTGLALRGSTLVRR